MSMQGVPFVMVALMAFTIMHHGSYSGIAAESQVTLEQIAATSGETISKQVTTSVVMANFLPIGLVGAMCAVMLASFISTHDTCLHSWGSIFIQDVVLPFRKTRLTPKRHLRWLKASAFGVAVWIFLFSLLFAQFDYIFMFFDLISIIGAGTGSAIIFGLYWKRGTTKAAFTSMIVGFICFFVCLFFKKYWPTVSERPLPLDARELRFASMLLTILTYIVVSLLQRGFSFNMDKMLHRGKYAVESDVVKEGQKPTGWMAKIGITDEFNLKDKIIYFFFSTWQVWWFIVFLCVIVFHLFRDIPDRIWSCYWQYSTWMNVGLALMTLGWFTIGGIRDLKKMFYRLRTQKRDETDDGEIVHE